MAFRYLSNADNKVTGSSVAASAFSTAAGYSANNLVTLPICKPHRTTGITYEYLDVDLGSAQSINLAALINHNLSSSATIRVKGGTGTGGSEYRTQVLADAPTAYWRMGDAEGQLVGVDETGNGMTGGVVDTDQFGFAGLLTGDDDTSAGFNGTNEYMGVLDHALLDLGTDTFTLECIVSRSSATGDRVLFDKGANGYQVLLNAGTVHFAKSGVATIASSTTTVPVTTATHIMVTKSGSTVKIYINGVDRTGAVTNQTIQTTATHLNICRYASGSGYYEGVVDEIAIYSTALSAARALAHYTAMITNLEHTIAWREFDAYALFTSESYRYWRFILEDSSNAYGFIQVGYLVLGPVTVIDWNFRYGWQRSLEYSNTRQESAYYVPNIEEVGRRYKIDLPFGPLSVTDMNTLRALYDSVKRDVTPLLLIPDTSVTDCYFGRFSGDFAETINLRRYVNLTFLEDGRGNRMAL